MIEHAGVISSRYLKDHLAELVLGADSDYVDPSSYDMRVGTLFPIDADLNAPPPERVRVKPGDFIRLFTLEELTLPADICAIAFALNKRSSEGLLVLNPGHVDAGYRGPLMVTAWNLSGQDQIIERGDRILKVLFQWVEDPGEPFGRSQPRDRRERNFRKKAVVSGARGLGALIEANADSPVATHADLTELRQQMTNSLSTRMSFFVAVVSLVIAISALVVTITPLVRELAS